MDERVSWASGYGELKGIFGLKRVAVHRLKTSSR